eukprot:11990100-Alexandrium_andersonii.AAC.1
MSASLVGSEMCIRDSVTTTTPQGELRCRSISVTDWTTEPIERPLHDGHRLADRLHSRKRSRQSRCSERPQLQRAQPA